MTTKGTAVECSMCGDHGFPNLLFKCTVCMFRSQHKYCSDLYPKAETYRICNWCLREEQGKALREEMEGRSVSNSNITNTSSSINSSSISNGSVSMKRSSPLLLNPIKKQRSSDSPTDKSEFSLEKASNKLQQQQKQYGVVRTSLGCTEELLRRSKSEELSNVAKTGLSRPIFRGKARRYKLLEEVSS